MMRIIMSGIVLASAVACTDGKPITYVETPAVLSQNYATNFQNAPFADGAISVVATENGELRTFTLTPCQNNTRICGARVGQVQQHPDYYIVTGAYAGRTFFLSPGGDGYLRRNGLDVRLAWN